MCIFGDETHDPCPDEQYQLAINGCVLGSGIVHKHSGREENTLVLSVMPGQVC